MKKLHRRRVPKDDIVEQQGRPAAQSAPLQERFLFPRREFHRRASAPVRRTVEDLRLFAVQPQRAERFLLRFPGTKSIRQFHRPAGFEFCHGGEARRPQLQIIRAFGN